jgi:hypothetical protein
MKNTQNCRSFRPHPYAYRPLPPPPNPVQQAADKEERLIASADLMAARMVELKIELEEANRLGIMLTYDKQAGGWAPWFRYVMFDLMIQTKFHRLSCVGLAVPFATVAAVQ